MRFDTEEQRATILACIERANFSGREVMAVAQLQSQIHKAQIWGVEAHDAGLSDNVSAAEQSCEKD